MSRLTDLLHRLEQSDPALARDLTREYESLASRRAFGLNFERHVPESVELPNRKVRRGDKVRFRARRGESGDDLDERLWLVTRVGGSGNDRTAHLIAYRAGDDPAEATRSVDDLIVVADEVEDEAEQRANRWLNDLRRSIGGLNEDRRAVYSDLQQRAREPQRVEIVTPISRIENTRDSENQLLPTRPHHLLSDEEGNFPVGSMNDWELQVIDTELAARKTLAWYRNPSRSTADALQIPYEMDDRLKPMQPDFIFFTRKQDGTYAASIVDPHGDHLADALPKLKGLARFAGKYGAEFQRIEAISQIDRKELRMLDMRDSSIREAVRNADSAKELYRSDHAVKYR